MSRAFSLEALGICLDEARTYAVDAGMDLHFVADIDHLAACVNFHKTMDRGANGENVANSHTEGEAAKW